MFSIETSKVPPPISNTKIFRSLLPQKTQICVIFSNFEKDSLWINQTGDVVLQYLLHQSNRLFSWQLISFVEFLFSDESSCELSKVILSNQQSVLGQNAKDGKDRSNNLVFFEKTESLLYNASIYTTQEIHNELLLWHALVLCFKMIRKEQSLYRFRKKMRDTVQLYEQILSKLRLVKF